MNIYVCIFILEFIKADHKRFYNKLHIPSLPWNYFTKGKICERYLDILSFNHMNNFYFLPPSWTNML